MYDWRKGLPLKYSVRRRGRKHRFSCPIRKFVTTEVGVVLIGEFQDLSNQRPGYKSVRFKLQIDRDRGTHNCLCKQNAYMQNMEPHVI